MMYMEACLCFQVAEAGSLRHHPLHQVLSAQRHGLRAEPHTLRVPHLHLAADLPRVHTARGDCFPENLGAGRRISARQLRRQVRDPGGQRGECVRHHQARRKWHDRGCRPADEASDWSSDHHAEALHA